MFRCDGSARFAGNSCETRTCWNPRAFRRRVIMEWKYYWLLLLWAIVSFLYARDIFNDIRMHLEDGTLSIADMVYFATLNENYDGQRVFTASELRRYSIPENGLYLSILGKVFDVTKGERHYGPGGSYHAFVGRDASLAFITGEFDKDLTDDVSSLSTRQIQALDDWLQFYNKNYIYKGKLYGRYYNLDGSPTAESHRVQEKLLFGKRERILEDERKRIFPPCNLEWNVNTGTVLWCSKKSGGVHRNWIGVPRMLFEGATQEPPRCVCVKLDSNLYEENSVMLKEYDGCGKYATKCILKEKRA